MEMNGAAVEEEMPRKELEAPTALHASTPSPAEKPSKPDGQPISTVRPIPLVRPDRQDRRPQAEGGQLAQTMTILGSPLLLN